MSINNVDVVRDLFEKVFAKGDFSTYNDLVDSNVEAHCPPSWSKFHKNEVSGISNTKKIDEAYQKAFKIINATIQDLIAYGDKVTIRWSCHGKHVGDFFEISATNKLFDITGMSIFRLNQGKIVEVWQSWDMFGLLQQLK